MTVHWSDTAIAQLQAVHDYIATNSSFYASRFVDKITRRSIQISDFPFSGRIVPEHDDDRIRELIEFPYRIIYEIREDDILVVSVVHGARILTL